MDSVSNDLVMVRLDEFEKLTEERFKSTAMALSLQAEENKRRLADLTVETERLRQAQNSYTSTPVFESYKRELDIRMKGLESKSDENAGRSKGLNDFWGWIVGLLGIGIAITTLFIHNSK